MARRNIWESGNANGVVMRILLTLLIAILTASLIFLMSGCAGQGVKLDVETDSPQCGKKTVKFSTDYQVEELIIGRTIEGGGEDSAGNEEGCGGGYTVSLGKGTTKDAELGVMVEMLRMIQSLMPGIMPPQSSEPE